MHSVQLATLSQSFLCALKRINNYLLGSSQQPTEENVRLIVKRCTLTLFWKIPGLYIHLKDQMRLCFFLYMWEVCEDVAKKKGSDQRTCPLIWGADPFREKYMCLSYLFRFHLKIPVWTAHCDIAMSQSMEPSRKEPRLLPLVAGEYGTRFLLILLSGIRN